MLFQRYEVNGNHLLVITDKGMFSLQPVTGKIVRCVYTRRESVLPGTFLVEESLPVRAFTFREDEGAVILSTGELELRVEKETCAFNWSKPDGTRLLRSPGHQLREEEAIRYSAGEEIVLKIEKTADGDRMSNTNLIPHVDRIAYRGKLFFEFGENEAIYGFGQAEEGIYNCRGHNQFLYQCNMRIPVPVMLSSNHYGIFFDCGSTMAFQDDYHGSSLWFDTIDQMDYYFIAGESFDELIAGYRMLTGSAAMLPKWAYGYIQSRETYNDQDELEAEAMDYRKRGIPLDCIVQDWRTWEPGQWGNKTPDTSRYPDINGLIERLHGENIHAMVSLWPNMNIGCANHKEFEENDLLLPDHATYNAFLPEARALYWTQMKAWTEAGFDAWWSDSSEGFCRTDWSGEYLREPWERFYNVKEELKRHIDPALANTFCVVHAKTIWEGQRRDVGQKRVVNLTRSGYASIQKYGAIVWSGDISSRWSVLKKQIAEGIRISMSGLPYWTIDIGAFFPKPGRVWFVNGEFPEGVDDFGYREFYVRCLQFACFLPVFRSHGTGTPREIRQFGEPGGMFYDSIASFIRLRYQLIPYIYSIAAKTTLKGYTMLRGLVFDFPGDSAVRDYSGAFMFGPAFLVCPVTEPMYYAPGGQELSKEKRWTCLLPAGTDWIDYWTGARYQGGSEVSADAVIDRLPLFVKAGSIIPMTETVENAEGEREKPLEIHVYTGADGSFDFYEDNGDGYGYEQGEYALTRFIWDDAGRLLTVNERKGSFPGMDMARKAVCVVGGRRIEFIADGTRKEIFM